MNEEKKTCILFRQKFVDFFTKQTNDCIELGIAKTDRKVWNMKKKKRT